MSAFISVASCNKVSDVFERDTDYISVSCNAGNYRHFVKVSGHWTLESSEDWLSFSPAEGDGHGVDYQEYTLSVAYNKGAAREGVYYLCSNGRRAEVKVSQQECSFKWGKLEFSGILIQESECESSVSLSYSGASGEESFSYEGSISGPGSEGLSIESGIIDNLTPGNGSILIPISGTPVNAGVVIISINVDGVNVGSVEAEVVEKSVAPDPDKELKGLPVGWNFYALGITTDEVKALPQTASWKKDSSPAFVLPTSGNNDGARFTAVANVGTITDRTFNPSIQVKGLLEGDYWLASIPVSSLAANTRLKLELGCGSAGGSAGYYMLEYSVNSSSWTSVPGAVSHTRGSDTFYAHLWNTASSIGMSGYTNTRKTYDKATDDTYRVYYLDSPEIESGVLYFRLRVLKYRATPEVTTEVAAGWTDIKGFEVSIAEE